ncbi:CDK-activating kinase assembly factor MAT1-like [Mizuhopecten yessoensis]|uniref:CDK-activating kinase assembly factor MAT1-like n=1 Tax=Mizuhopecten yessoensis TaxID=6573 RepID=UPI000B458A68|nr:CDK-activating kinase assembly factor MAT1-like [Mizuhopecten yessoensis]
MDELGCPRCKTTKYRNPSLKLLVNICGHSLCESCVDLLFIKGSGACPECGTALRRNNFRLQLFEDSYIEKEVEIRKKLSKDFNKKEEDFDTLNGFNDYLEMVETIVFNLTNNDDVENTKKMIDEYRRDNKDQIMKNKSKLGREEEYLELLIEQEKQTSEVRKHLYEEEAKMDKKNLKKKNTEALLDELEFSDLPASHIMATHKADIEHQEEETATSIPIQAATKFSTGIRLGMSTSEFEPAPEQKVEVYSYSPIELMMCGPDPPSEERIMQEGFLRNVRETSNQEKGGGYESRMACQRALMDAMCGLFFFPCESQTFHKDPQQGSSANT